MKSRLSLLLSLGLGLIAAVSTSAQFSGMDNFAGVTINTTNWTLHSSVVGTTSTFSQNNGLYYQGGPELTASYLEWNQSIAMTQDWNIIVNLTRPYPFTLTGNNLHVEMGLMVHPSTSSGAPPPNSLGIYLDTATNGSGTQFYDIYTHYYDAGVDSGYTDFVTTTSTAALKIAYTASSQTLNTYYNIGSGWTEISSGVNVNSVWGMTGSDTFKLGILADSVGPTITPADGFLANSFSAAAIPEPSTYAGMLGSLAVLFALIRRRKD